MSDNNPHAKSHPHPTHGPIPPPADEAQRVRGAAQKAPITNRMEDCGAGRHVGWWFENYFDEKALLIEVDKSVLFACCEGPRGDKRINFVTAIETGRNITRALMKALGIAAIPPPLRAITRAAWTEELRRARQALADQGGHHAALEGLIVVIEAALGGLTPTEADPR